MLELGLRRFHGRVLHRSPSGSPHRVEQTWHRPLRQKNCPYYPSVVNGTFNTSFEFCTLKLYLPHDNFRVTFAYVPPKSNSNVYEQLAEQVRPSDLLIRDLNLNTLTSSDYDAKMEQLLHAMDSQQILHEATHVAGGQLDHCLLKNTRPRKSFQANSFKTTYSDHSYVAVRVDTSAV